MLFLLSVFCAPFATAQGQDSLAVERMIWDATELLKTSTPGVVVASSAAEPGMVPSVYIEGASLSQWQQPVYIINGIRMLDVSSLAAEDIAEIRVLMGAEAIAAYGHDAMAGAVVIRTKRAEEQGFHARYSFLGGPQWVSSLPDSNGSPQWNCKPEDFLETAFQQQHHVEAQYARDRIQARASFSSSRGSGPFEAKTDRYIRHSLQAAISVQILPWLTVESAAESSSFEKADAPYQWLMKKAGTAPPSYPASQYKGKDGYEDWAQLRLSASPLEMLEINAFMDYRDDMKYDKSVLWGLNGRPEDYTYKMSYSERDLQRGDIGVDALWKYLFGKDHMLSAAALLQWNKFFALHKYYTGSGKVNYMNFQPLDNKAVLDRYKDLTGIHYADYYTDKPNESWWETRLMAEYAWKHNSSDVGDTWFTLNGGFHLIWALGDVETTKTVLSPFVSVVAGWHLDSQWIPRLQIALDWAEAGKASIEQVFEAALSEAGYYSMVNDAVMNTFDPLCLSAGGVRRSVGLSLDWQDKTSLGIRYYRNRDNIETYQTFSTPRVRPSSVRNEGLSFSGKKGGNFGDWKWEVSGHYSLMRNRFLSEDPFYYTKNSRLINGLPLGQARLDKDGVPVYEGEDGVMPRAVYGLRTALRWKNRWGLSIQGYGWGGNRIYCAENWYKAQYYQDAEAEIYPRVRFFRLSQVAFDYRIPESLISRAYLRGARLWISLEDIALFTNYRGLDPEAALFIDSLGQEIGKYPVMARAVFGISLNL